MSQVQQEKEALIRYFRWLRHYGYNDSHSGNASIRCGNTIWITPTGCCADTVDASMLIACEMDGRIGDNASGDAGLHIAIYQQNPKTRAVLHSHGPYSVALTLDGRDFIPSDFEGRIYFPCVPVISIPYEDYFALSAPQVSEKLSRYPITVVRGHGVYAAAENIDLAYKWTCSLELSAKTQFIARHAGTIT